MPKVLEKNGFVFYFFAADCRERSHMHVKKGDGRGKVWLEPEVEVFYFRGFKQQEQRQIMALVNEHLPHLKQQWDAYCNH
jgi:hypothetical protein